MTAVLMRCSLWYLVSDTISAKFRLIVALRLEMTEDKSKFKV